MEYHTREDAENAIRYLSRQKLDDQVIRCDWDAGFKEGRQYGRGKSGGQVRDEYYHENSDEYEYSDDGGGDVDIDVDADDVEILNKY